MLRSTESRNQHDRIVGVLPTCMPKPTRIKLSCDPEVYRGRPVGGVWKSVGVLHFTGIIASSVSHLALSQHLLSFLLYVSVEWTGEYWLECCCLVQSLSANGVGWFVPV